ncbi:MAG: rhomboid family intramembrane serine protease [Caulobacter sp.]
MTTPEDPNPPEEAPAPRRERLFGTGPAILWFEAWPVLVALGLIWAVFAVQLASQALDFENELLSLGAFHPGNFREGLWWTPISYIFLHAGWFHIAMNSAALVALGPGLAQRFGRDALGGLLFAGLFLVCGAAGAMLAMLFSPDSWLVGASGAICGLWGAGARLAGPGRAELAPIFSSQVGRSVGSFVVMNLIVVVAAGAYGLASKQGLILVSWQAHLGGFVLGFLLIQVMPVRFHWLKGLRAA